MAESLGPQWGDGVFGENAVRVCPCLVRVCPCFSRSERTNNAEIIEFSSQKNGVSRGGYSRTRLMLGRAATTPHEKRKTTMIQGAENTTPESTWDVLNKAARRLSRSNPDLSGKLSKLADAIQEEGDPFSWAVTKEEARPGRINDRQLRAMQKALSGLQGEAVELAADELAMLVTTTEEPAASPYVFGLQGTLPRDNEEDVTLVLLGDPSDDGVYSIHEFDNEQDAVDEAERFGERGIRAFVVNVVSVFGPESVAEDDDEEIDDDDNPEDLED